MTADVFNQIAESWYNFRHRSIFHPELETFAERWRRGRLLNVGCAHGPDFLPFKNDFELHGVDYASAMLGLAQKYARKYKLDMNLVEADARRLPYVDDAFDWAIAVATYHHINDKEERLEAVKELRRVLKPGGEAFITVWNRWQPKFWLKSKNTLVPWKSKDKTLYRYYYLFTYRELEELARRAGLEILKSFPEVAYRLPVKEFSRNVCILVRNGTPNGK